MRNYIVASWNDADQYDYSGEQIGDRQSKSQKVHFNADGSACVASYGDPEPVKKTIPLADRVLPQQRTLSKLIDQIKELEQAKRSGVYTQAEYDLLRDVLFSKKERAEYLLAKQRARKPKSSTQSDEALSHILHTNASNQPKNLQQKRKFACNSAVRDAIVFLTGSLALLVLVKLIF